MGGERLFESLVDSRRRARSLRRPLTFAAALGLHAATLGVVLGVSHLAAPAEGEAPVQVAFLEFAPPPPPLGPPASAAQGAPAERASAPPADTASEPLPSEILQPQVTPEPIPVERVAEAPPSFVDDGAATLEADDPQRGESNGDAGDPAGGVPGGIAGGVPDGAPGGVPGGVPGGRPGGVLGGRLGGPLAVGGDVSAPVVISRTQPAYPASARHARVEGQVKLEAVIRRDGTVGDVRVIQGLRMGCTEAAIEALKHWRFKPGERNGIPVDVYFELTVDFIQAH